MNAWRPASTSRRTAAKAFSSNVQWVVSTGRPGGSSRMVETERSP